MVRRLETFGGGWRGCGLGSVCVGRVRRIICLLCRPSLALSCNENDAEHLDRDQPYPSSQKTKRMRTSFKHHQLRTMKSYFAINHNPDAKDLKQLAQKTGLTKRVLQVSWGLSCGWGHPWLPGAGAEPHSSLGLGRIFLLMSAFLFVYLSLCSVSISSVYLYFNLSPPNFTSLSFNFCL